MSKAPPETRTFTLDDLASAAGLPRRTVRYYIQLGLLDKAEGETRAARYGATHLEQLIAIRRWSQDGLSLERIRDLLARKDSAPAPASRPPGTVEVWSHLVVADGLEVMLEARPRRPNARRGARPSSGAYRHRLCEIRKGTATMEDATAIHRVAQMADTQTLEGVTATGRVSGLFFELTVEQRYRNATGRNIEAVYTFPLPWGAELMSLEFDLGGRTLAGTVVPRKVGEERYEDAIDAGDTAVLLERAADGVYTANVGNLMPGESAIVRYRYAQLLRLEKGHVRLTVPTVIAPRYGNAESQAGLAPHQVPASNLLADYPFEIAIERSKARSLGRVLQSPRTPSR